ncbi:YihY/virulence factor BrkB family protein [Prevotella sp. kh1p2]|uniref:YihY/virulence factor BrkB family protein n=1 Tax=Prevotella sp. kh1p2 TaxID=1761883 RepID=UPI0008B91ECF|nr:YihY/virulence factor BrkB family protein [Prevotella sp. kh1p2]SET06841.1 membrane protein [Prevotella sp. kh1p2]SNU10895.1 membrane protein [Prevotellaceae bacterium KH2P17]
MNIKRIIQFMTHDIWQITLEEVSPLRYLVYGVLKKLYLAVRFFINKGVIDAASALTYSTMLALVPILAVVFAIARGFGYSKYIELWFRDALSAQPQVADTIITFVNSYLVHTHSGLILGVGLVVMLGTVLLLIRNIEHVFNDIWQVTQERSILRTFTDYLAMFVLIPVFIVFTSGLSIFMTVVVDNLNEFLLLGPLMRFLLDLMPYVLMSVVFVALYIFMPNTKVKLTSALVPGILAGVAMQLLQFFYIHFQMLLSGYNAIYGSFAALPLFMLWLQISWTICLFGAELSYTNQNLEDFAFLTTTADLSHRYRLLLSALLLSRICKRFAQGKKPYTALELKLETEIPIRITSDLLHDMVKVNLITENHQGDSGDAEPVFQPAESLDNITMGTMVDRLESAGRWKLDIDLDRMMSNESWARFYGLRKKYLDDLRSVPLAEL